MRSLAPVLVFALALVAPDGSSATSLRFGSAAWSMAAAPVALNCVTRQPPGGNCYFYRCNTAEGTWEKTWNIASTPCDDANAATINDVCIDDSGTCRGVGTPGAISVSPTGTIRNGSYTLSWAAPTAGYYTRFDLYENDVLIAQPTSTSSSVSRNDGTYRYKVRACDPWACGNFTGDTYVTVALVPNAPVSFNAPSSSIDGSVYLSWAAPYGPTVTGYKVDRKPSGGYWSTIWNANALSYTDNVASGTYAYRVSAHNANGDGSYTAERTVTVLVASAPGTMSGPATSTTGSHRLSWAAATGTVGYYEFFENSQSIGTTTNTWYDVSGRADGTYKYKARTCNTAGCTAAYTNEVTVTVLHAPGVPTITSSPLGAPSYTVSWVAGSGTVTSFTYQDSLDNVTWNTISTTGNSYSYANRLEGTYYHRVKACNSSGCSDWATRTVAVVSDISGPIQSSGTYTLTFTIDQDYIRLQEMRLGGSPTVSPPMTATSQTFTKTTDGIWDYSLQHCTNEPPLGSPACGDFQAAHRVDVQIPPSQPGAIAVSADQCAGSYTLSWGESTGTNVSYYLQTSTDNVTWSTTPAGTALSYGRAGVGNGTYYHRVYAKNRYESTMTPAVAVQIQKICAPSSMSTSGNNANGNVTVSWSASSGTVTSYEVAENGTTVATVAAPSVSTSLTRTDGTYSYQVRGCNSVSCTAYAGPKSVTVLLAPAAPTITAPTSSGPSYTVSWAPNSSTISRYELEQSPDAVTWTALAFTGTSVSLTSQAAGKHYYRVRGCNSTGCGAWAQKLVTVTSDITGPNESSGEYTLTFSIDYEYIRLEETPLGGSPSYSVSADSSKTITKTADGIFDYRLQQCMNQPPAGSPPCGEYLAVHRVDVQIPPSTPGALAVTADQCARTYTLSWNASTGTNVSYYVESSPDGTTWSPFAGPLSTTSYTRTDVADGTYYHRVYAKNRYASEAGASVSQTILAICPPGSITAPSNSTTGSYTVSWGASTGTVAWYELVEGSKTLNAGTNTWLDRNVDDGTYMYKARGCNAVSCTPYTQVVTTVVLLPPAPPRFTMPQEGDNDYTVTWEPMSATVDTYDLDESIDNVTWTPLLSRTAGTSFDVPYKPEGRYFYRVRGYNASGHGLWGTDYVDVTSFMTGPTEWPPVEADEDTAGPYAAPPPPCTLSWNPGGDYSELAYRPQFDGFTVDPDKYALETSCAREMDAIWDYKVRFCTRATDQDTGEPCGAWGAIHSVDVQYRPEMIPVRLVSNDEYTGDVTIAWDAPSTAAGRNTGITAYEVDVLGALSQRVSVAATLPSYSHTVASAADGQYYFSVRAENRHLGPWSIPVPVTVFKRPTAPSPVTASAFQASRVVFLVWAPAYENIEWYRIEERRDGAWTRDLYTGGDTTDLAITDIGADGSYTYTVYAGNTRDGVEREGPGATSNAATILSAPVSPAPVTVVASGSAGAFTVSWTSPAGYRVDSFQVTRIHGAMVEILPLADPLATSLAEAVSEGGLYSYSVIACNSAGCSSPATAVAVVELDLDVVVPDAEYPGDEPEVASEDVGAIAGSADVSGGAATYTVPIEAPPGILGMQPSLALSYSSRDGNGIAGVGWSLSGTSSIYRCPRTLSQDGSNRPVQHDVGDALCFAGQQLVWVSGTYGAAGSTYRTEVNDYSRVTLKDYGIDDARSRFVVEQKSGRVSVFQSMLSSGIPDTWMLVAEHDRLENCIAYEWTRQQAPFTAWALTSVAYTRKGNADWTSCEPMSSSPERRVALTYESRDDMRTTYAAGVETSLVSRLHAAVTYVGETPIRRYELTYRQSGATGRSLLARIDVCQGATCDSGVRRLPPTEFQYSDPAPVYERRRIPSPVGAATVAAVGDFDGDGTLDRLFTGDDSVNRERRVEMSRCGGTSTRVTDTDGNSLLRTHWSDVNRDGRAELVTLDAKQPVLKAAGSCGLAVSASQALSSTPLLDSAWATPMVFSSKDYNGDGVPDLYVTGSTAGIYANGVAPPAKMQIFGGLVDGGAVRYEPARTLPVLPIPASPDDPGTCAIDDNTKLAGCYQSTITELDYNGDGKIDELFENSGTLGNLPPTITFRASGADTITRAPKVTPLEVRATHPSIRLADLGGPSAYFTIPNVRLRWMDVNGDGLPDIYSPGTIYINRGGSPIDAAGAVHRIFDAIPISNPLTAADLTASGSVVRWEWAMIMDVDGDGAEELLVPTVRVGTWCWTVDYSGTVPENTDWCGDQFDDPALNAPEGNDRSIFEWNAFRFRPRTTFVADELVVRYAAERVAGFYLKAPVNDGATPSDIDGDGLSDVVYGLNKTYSVENPSIVHGSYDSLAEDQYGPNASLRIGGAPDLLTKVTRRITPESDPNGSQRALTAAWGYQPLSNATDTCGSAKADQSFYTVHTGLPRAPGHVFFTSSMWAVSSFAESNGVGSTNPTCYRYEDAMLDEGGRGFLGFKKIISEEVFPCSTRGEEGSCSDGRSPNNRLITTEFNQEYPYIGRIASVTVEAAKTGKRISVESKTWSAVYLTGIAGDPEGAEYGSAGGVSIYERLSKQATYDPYGSIDPSNPEPQPIATTVAVISQFDAVSGEATEACTVVDDGAAYDVTGFEEGLDQFARPVVTKVETSVENRTGADDWWVGKVTQKTTTKGFGVPADPQNPDCGMVLAIPRRTRTSFTWLADGSRQLDTESLYEGAAGAERPERSTQYAYDEHGNVLTRSVRDLSQPGDTSLAAQTTITGPDRTSAPDPYLLTTVETNLLGEGKLSLREAATGKVTFEEDVLSGVARVTRYDWLGRPTSTVTGAPAPDGSGGYVVVSPEIRVSEVAARAECGGDASKGVLDATTERITRQAGAPRKWECLDQVGRVVRTVIDGAVSGFVTTATVYNERGQKYLEYAPEWNATGTAVSSYYTKLSSFDVLGRARKKTVARAADLFESSKGEAQLETTYSYSGFKTTITLNRLPGTPLSLSRTMNASGKLVATTQPGASGEILTRYLYDPTGAVAYIVDTAGNTLSATYDGLGRLKVESDPDRGEWEYAWDGLGRLEHRYDARDVMTTNQYDGAGRLIQRTTTTPEGQSVDQWIYEQGVLKRMVGGDGFERTFDYDTARRPVTITTKIPKADAAASSEPAFRTFTVKNAYDQNYGRLKSRQYPGATGTGEMVALQYSDRGFPLGERELPADWDLSHGEQYRQVGSVSARGQVTSEAVGRCMVDTAEYDDSTGLVKHLGVRRNLAACAGPSEDVRVVDYQYDNLLNLTYQHKVLQASGSPGYQAWSTERYQYDALQRLTSSEVEWPGSPENVKARDDYTYDDLGNIESKSNYASDYAYPAARTARDANNGWAGPHAVRSVIKDGVEVKFDYDANGNLVSGDGRDVDFDGLGRPVEIREGGITTDFAYAPDGSRYRQQTTGPSSPKYGAKTMYYVDKDYELVVWDTGELEERTYVSSSAIVHKSSSTGREVRYVHADRLGSIDVVTTSAGAVVWSDVHGFDPFGMPRRGDETSSDERLHPGGDGGATTDRGFTGHEHLDNHRLIHMNGRVYDYRLGRFLSVDPVISDPANSQSINPYSYIGNNPLSGVDPTGYFACDPSSASCIKTGSHIPGVTPNDAAWAFERNTTSTGPISGASNASPKQASADPPRQESPAAVATNSTTEGGGEDRVGAIGGRRILTRSPYNYSALELGYIGMQLLAEKVGWRDQDTRDVSLGIMMAAPELRAGVVMRDVIAPAVGSAAAGFGSALRLGSRMTAAEATTIDPALVRFSQRSVKATFSNGTSLNEAIAALRAGGADAAAKFPPIRLFERNGLLYTLDNRRLVVFSQAGQQVPFRMATSAEVAAETAGPFSKLTTTANQGWGRYITIRGGHE